MLHIWNKTHFARSSALLLSIALLAGCSSKLSRPVSGAPFTTDGLAVGFVTNVGTASALKPHQRSRYADKLASAILESNARLSGLVDSYGYVSARMGDQFGDVINSYRLEGDLSPRALRQLKSAQLRRRYLMLATISGTDESIELPVDVNPVVGPSNPEVDDYQDVRFHTVRLKAVRVQVYDTQTARKIQDQIYSSDDHDIMLATQRTGRRYVGNSLLGALANSVSNRVRRASDVDHPPAPTSEQTLDYLWRRIAQEIPGARSL